MNSKFRMKLSSRQRHPRRRMVAARSKNGASLEMAMLAPRFILNSEF
jgi:hypothetical protein